MATSRSRFLSRTQLNRPHAAGANLVHVLEPLGSLPGKHRRGHGVAVSRLGIGCRRADYSWGSSLCVTCSESAPLRIPCVEIRSHKPPVMPEQCKPCSPKMAIEWRRPWRARVTYG